jgi:hypothetical protein
MTKYKRFVAAVQHLDDYRKPNPRSAVQAAISAWRRTEGDDWNAKMVARRSLPPILAAADEGDDEDAVIRAALYVTLLRIEEDCAVATERAA